METYYLSPTKPEARSSLIVDKWRPLYLLNGFRLLLSSLFIFLTLTENIIAPLASYSVDLFFTASIVYLCISLVLWFLHRTQTVPHNIQVYISVLTDIIVIMALMHASGGIQSGLGVIIVVSIASSSIVMSGRVALGFAAIASIAILLQQIYSGWIYPDGVNYTGAGLLGLTYFATAIVFNILAQRIRESEDLAKRRGIDIANLAQLTQHVIQRMQTGVIVIDEKGSMRLINESALQMLNLPESAPQGRIQDICPELSDQWVKWQLNSNINLETIQLNKPAIDLLPRFARIGDDISAGTLIFLQDMAAMAQHAQQLQLASLGRLTASIAHEIRNPLGAISHAGQLLAESTNMDSNDLRLTQIISEQSKRLNIIIENVMSVSRRQATNVSLLDLEHFIEKFVSDYTSGQNINSDTIKYDIKPKDLKVRFDASHLHQILVNLCENAIRHSYEHPDGPQISIIANFEDDSSRPHLDIIDNGPGISDEILPNIFEPFFTTEMQGTGLGLYLSKELAENNQAHLNYIKRDAGQRFFRITFQDPRRQFD